MRKSQHIGILTGFLGLVAVMIGSQQVSATTTSNVSQLLAETEYSFTPSLGINVEEAKSEEDSVGGQPLPFVDVQRAFGVYGENNGCPYIEIDEHKNVSKIPASCATYGDFDISHHAVTSGLRSARVGDIPEGQYTVLYDGEGVLKFSGTSRVASEITVSSGGNNVKGYLIDVSIADKRESDQIAGLRYEITETNSDNYIRNIRIIMPGSACRSDLNEDVWLTEETDCVGKETMSFVDILAADRNTILFNPDYLRELKKFKTVRMMNLIKASPKLPDICTTGTDEEKKACLYMPLTWDMRSKMDDASWGASGKTGVEERYGRGVPPEVLIALANTLNIDPWFTIPHSATDEYVIEFSHLVKSTLSPNLKPSIEYSNETWNDGFWATKYVRSKGMDENLSLLRDEGDVIGCPVGGVCNEFWAGAFYTSKRSKEIFTLWGDVWGIDRPFVRVLSGHTPNAFQTRHMLNFENTADSVDVFAVAPYFEACRDRMTHEDCKVETGNVPQTINELAALDLDQEVMVDRLFELINNSSDRYGIDATLGYMAEQAEVAAEFDVRLYAYEGGQHLVVHWIDSGRDEVTLTTVQKNALRDAMAQANRDPRMKDLYARFLNGWKDAGGELMTLYTMPQGFHDFGNFGLKDGLNAPLDESPKYDATMTFQEEQGQPWFSDIEVRKGFCHLDIDDSLSLGALSDGLLLYRYLSEHQGASLIENALSDGAVRDSSSDIEKYIETCLPDFDIDADGETVAESDGTLVMRYLFGFRGEALVSGIVGAEATRSSVSEIENYLESLSVIR